MKKFILRFFLPAFAIFIYTEQLLAEIAEESNPEEFSGEEEITLPTATLTPSITRTLTLSPTATQTLVATPTTTPTMTPDPSCFYAVTTRLDFGHLSLSPVSQYSEIKELVTYSGQGSMPSCVKEMVDRETSQLALSIKDKIVNNDPDANTYPPRSAETIKEANEFVDRLFALYKERPLSIETGDGNRIGSFAIWLRHVNLYDQFFPELHRKIPFLLHFLGLLDTNFVTNIGGLLGCDYRVFTHPTEDRLLRPDEPGVGTCMKVLDHNCNPTYNLDNKARICGTIHLHDDR